MKIISIGDVHGTSHWKKILFGGDAQFENFFRDFEEGKPLDSYPISRWGIVVFVGDYFDSFVISNIEMKRVFEEIVRMKRTLGEKVVLLLGNHDLHYIDSKAACSGFRPEMFHDFNQLMRENRDLFQAAFQYKNFLWTHAGLTQSTWNNFCVPRLKQAEAEGMYDISKLRFDTALNFLYEINYTPIFWVGRGRGGYTSSPGIFWADKKELQKDPVSGISQIVGHTPVPGVETYFCNDLVGNMIYFIDCQERGTKEYLEIDPDNNESDPTHKHLKKMKY